MTEQSNHVFEFGPYRLDSGERLLLRGDEVVPLTPKAFEMLLVLVENSGHVLTKEELMKHVWPDTIVEEANLSHNIYKLREALGEGRSGEKYIKTVPRRGYRFVGNVTELRDEDLELVVAGHTRARVVIEEETSSAPAPMVSPATPETAPRKPSGSFTKRGLVLIALARLLVGGAGAAIWSGLLRGSSHSAERSVGSLSREMKITRVTNSGTAGDIEVTTQGKNKPDRLNLPPGDLRWRAGAVTYAIKNIGKSRFSAVDIELK